MRVSSFLPTSLFNFGYIQPFTTLLLLLFLSSPPSHHIPSHPIPTIDTLSIQPRHRNALSKLGCSSLPRPSGAMQDPSARVQDDLHRRSRFRLVLFYISQVYIPANLPRSKRLTRSHHYRNTQSPIEPTSPANRDFLYSRSPHWFPFPNLHPLLAESGSQSLHPGNQEAL